MENMEKMIQEWRHYLERSEAVGAADADELEDHLRSQIDALKDAGLREDEAFLIAVKRIGEVHELSGEFGREHSERLWKRFKVPDAGNGVFDRESIIVIFLSLLAALSFKIPSLFGLHFGVTEAAETFYARNISFFSLPFLTAYFAWKRGMELKDSLYPLLLFAGGAAVMNLYPFSGGSHTEILAVIHFPLLLWFVAGYAYSGSLWQEYGRRMNFIRFSGEWFIYFVLIALGGGVLTLFTLFIFESIGLNAEDFISQWLLPCGAMGAVIIAAWLVESKQNVIENIAPVLSMIFTPLFSILLLVFLSTMLVTGKLIGIEREVLIGFDLLLVVVLGLILYNISARDPLREAGWQDMLQLVLVVSALLVDAVALSAILGRISEYGFSPNRVAALGENLILVVNLSGSAFLYAKFLRKKAGFAALEGWQTAYLPVYALWFAFVVVVFPILFIFR